MVGNAAPNQSGLTAQLLASNGTTAKNVGSYDAENEGQDLNGQEPLEISKVSAQGGDLMVPAITSPWVAKKVPESAHMTKKTRQLLRKQVSVSCIIMFAEGFNVTQMFPYAASMVLELRGDSAALGFFAGMLYTSTSFGMLGTTYLWARASNRFGRKACLLVGLANNVVLSLLAAISHNYTLMVVLRLLTGVLSSNLAIVRTSLRERFQHEDEDDTRAFSALSVGFGAASVAGPSLGGLLYNASIPCGDSDGGWCSKLRDVIHPWSLSYGLSTLFYVIALLSVALQLEETAFLSLPMARPKPQHFGTTARKPVPSKDRSTLLTDTSFLLLMFMGGGHSYVFTGWELVYPLLARIPSEQGGEGWSTANIGSTFLVGSLGLVLYSLLAFPALAKKFKIIRIWQFSSLIPAIAMPIFPRALAVMCDMRMNATVVYVTNYLTQLLVSVFLGSGFIGIQLLINNYVSKRHRGSHQLAVANGCLVSTQALVRAASPLSTGLLFTMGTNAESNGSPVLSRALPFDSLCVMLLIFCCTASWLFEERTMN